MSELGQGETNIGRPTAMNIALTLLTSLERLWRGASPKRLLDATALGEVDETNDITSDLSS